ncbi:unnamed protein product [Bursaphelenchus okinawaensis]|uniref:Ribosomal RNA-processing protein 7 C-terminal domain-containing protein n=1 Tax=Bursaphelenchus okinawaensis TaxID=465554 RepID=A0A811JS68_9BILA|nr:unnamed protein product [Bursaphelenchus okinawaensis]CAG9080755.1 unnamed protein product [Bursaphelenchus okinawaensis]
MTVKKNVVQELKEEADSTVFKVLYYKIAGSNVDRQMFVKKDPSDNKSLVLGSIPFFLTTEKLLELFQTITNKKSVDEVVKRGDNPNQGYTSAKVTFLTEKSAESTYNKVQTLDGLTVSRPSGFGLQAYVKEYNEGLQGFKEELQRANIITQAHQEFLVNRKAEAKNKKNKPDEDGWVTVTSKDRHVFKSPKLAGIKKKTKGKKPEAKKSIQLL